MQLDTETLIGGMFIVGLVLTIYSFNIAGDVDSDSSAKAGTKKAARGLIVLSTAILAMSITALTCGCGGGGKNGTAGMISSKDHKMALAGMMAVLAVVVLVLASMIKSDSATKSVKGVTTLITVAVLGVVVSGGYIGYEMM